MMTGLPFGFPGDDDGPPWAGMAAAEAAEERDREEEMRDAVAANAEAAEHHDLMTLLPIGSLILAADQNDLLGKLAKKINAFEPDVSTVQGRKAIASLAAEVAKTKMDLIRLGKGLTEGWRKSTKAVNAECNAIEERLDDLKEKVRRPLTDFENAEFARVEGHLAALAEIDAIGFFNADPTSAEITRRLLALDDVPHRDWQEFADRARHTIARTEETLLALRDLAVEREAREAEAARVRAEEMEKQRQLALKVQKEREERIAAAAAERARLEAERKAEAELQRAARDKLDAELREKAERERADAAERRHKETLAKAECEKQAAVERERKRLEDEAAAAKREADCRAADAAHRRTINVAVAAALAEIEGITAEMAKVIVTRILTGRIPHCQIEY